MSQPKSQPPRIWLRLAASVVALAAGAVAWLIVILVLRATL
jgi:hypothetical protein